MDTTMNADNTEPAAEADELIAELNERDGWSVADYSFTTSDMMPPSLTLELEYTSPPPEGDKGVVLDIINEIVDEYPDDPGAHADYVIERVVEDDDNDLGAMDVMPAIVELRRTGDVYEPQPDYLRTV